MGRRSRISATRLSRDASVSITAGSRYTVVARCPPLSCEAHNATPIGSKAGLARHAGDVVVCYDGWEEGVTNCA